MLLACSRGSAAFHRGSPGPFKEQYSLPPQSSLSKSHKGNRISKPSSSFVMAISGLADSARGFLAALDSWFAEY